MTTLTAEKNAVEVIVIDPDEMKAERVKKLLERSIKNIVAVNTRCLSLQRERINELVADSTYNKVFYGCDKLFFDKMVESFKVKHGELIHLGWKLDISEIIIFYWKQKGYGVFSPTISKSEGTFGQEL